MWQDLRLRIICWFRGHDWEARGGSFGLSSVGVCRRCGRQSNE